ncbi:MAG TPA: hypothetical protein VHY83_02805 [Solirubrobacteraceae bacterium]|jgi:uncharacterized membrane protein|nr:hypothetical protein [Solirubrobacteraceae bacterium]
MASESLRSPYLGAAILAGAATGLRSTVGVAALIDDRSSGLPTWLARGPAVVLARLAVTGELVVDKLPSTASRLEPAGLAARAAFAAFAGAVIARSADQPVVPAAIVASATALASARIGHDVRVAASQRLQPCGVAAAEDGLALALAGAAAERRP